jgi:hypothetical protein
MSKLVSIKGNAHWYFPNGTPCYEQEMASKPGKMRNTTLADARKLGLLPSVTTIIQLLAKPFLTAWQVEQAILSSLTLGVIPGESIDDRAARIVKDAEAQVEQARKVGSLLHDACEAYITLSREPEDPLIKDLWAPFKTWWDANCEEAYFCETPVVGDGYAGRVDAKAKLRGIGTAILDFKGRKFDKAGKAMTYDEDGMQLGAYRLADARIRPLADRCVSIMLNNVPGSTPSLQVHVWDDEELNRLTAAFLQLKNVWCLLKNYTPPPSL